MHKSNGGQGGEVEGELCFFKQYPNYLEKCLWKLFQDSSTEI